MTKTSLRFRIDFDGLCSVGFGKIALLEKISQTGSLSQAARDMGMSYRRAWLLVDSMNTGFDEPVVNANVGGSGGGGATLTPFGQQVIDTFRKLEPKLESIAEKHLRDVATHVVKSRGKAISPANKKQRKTLAKRNLR